MLKNAARRVFVERLLQVALGLLLGCAASFAARADIPTIKLQSGAPVTPTAAWTFYGSPASPAISTAARPVEIKALARALSRGGAITGDAFAERVSLYVRRNIETEFRFGLGKGARGAVIDQYGTPFDQAQLMVEILREGGMAASYRLGTITLTATDFGKWTGLITALNQASQGFTVRARAACQMLADGGIPAMINNNSSLTACTTFGTGTNMTTVTLGHVWVLANGKVYDPSYKTRLFRTGIDIPAAMQCGTAGTPTCGNTAQTQAMLSAQQGTQFTASYIQGVNRAALETQLQTYATNLENAIAALAGGRDLPLEEVIGGGFLNDGYAPTAGANLPYTSATQATWNGEIPNAFRTTFSVQLNGLNSGSGVTLYADELSGKRIRVTTGAPQNSWQRTTNLFVDNVNVGTGVVTLGPQQQDRPILSMNYPFAANAAGGTANGTYADDTFTVAGPYDARDASFCIFMNGGNICGLGHSQAYTIVLNLGQSGPGQEQHYSRIRADGLDTYLGQTVWEPALMQRPPFAAPLFVQSTAAMRLIGGLTKTTVTPHHSVGLQFLSYMPGDGQHYFNIESAVSIAHTNNDATWRTAAFNAYGSVISALEGSVRQQSQDSFESSASASVFKLYNDVNRRFFEVTSTSMLNSVLANSQNYSAGAQAILQSHMANGYSIILPQIAQIASYPLASGSVNYAITPEFAFKTDRISPLINGEYKGGGAMPALDPLRTAVQSVEANTYSLKKRDYWSFDLASGTLNLTPPPDLTVGAPGAPGALSFSRSYSSARDPLMECQLLYGGGGGGYGVTVVCSMVGEDGNSHIGGAWSHNLNRTAEWSSNGLEALGQTSALRAAGSIARIFAIADVNRTSNFSRRMTSMFATQSLIASFMRNSITVNSPPASYTFIKLPSGLYSPPPTAKGTSVTVSGAPGAPFAFVSGVLSDYSPTTLVFTDAVGAVTNFVYGEGMCGLFGNFYCVATPRYVARETILPNGVQQRFTYDNSLDGNRGQQLFVLKSVATSTGNQINLVYPGQVGTSSGTLNGVLFDTPPKLGSANDGGGRTVTMACEPSSAGACVASGATFTDTMSGVTRTNYGPASGSPAWGSQAPPLVMGSWFTPSNTGTPYLRFDYDTALHLASATDMAGKRTDMFVASVSDERWRLGESRDPAGAVTSTVFDRYGRALQIADPLNQITRQQYDNAGQLTRVEYPEGGATEYQYDARGNRTRECRIAKERGTASCNTSLGDLAINTTYVDAATVIATLCANRKTCNSPSFVVDARGNRTDYVWSTTHGEIVTVTAPADAAGLRPQTDYGYTAFTGTDGAQFYLTASKTDKIDATTSVVTSYSYEAAANRFAVKEQVADVGGLALRSCFEFDATGNLISNTEPKAGLGACP